jgi:hypothetical protein
MEEIYTMLVERTESNTNIFMNFATGATYFKKLLLTTTFNLMTKEDDDNDSIDLVQKKKVILAENTDNFRNVVKVILSGQADMKAAKELYIITEKVEAAINDTINNN